MVHVHAILSLLTTVIHTKNPSATIFNTRSYVKEKFFAEPGLNPDRTWTEPFGPEPEVQVQGLGGQEVNLEVRVRGLSKCARTWTKPDPGQTTVTIRDFVTIYFFSLSKRLLSYLIFRSATPWSLHIAMKSHSPDVYFILGYRVFVLFIF